MSKYLISALLLIVLGTLKMGAMGAVVPDPLPVAQDTALLNQSPIPQEVSKPERKLVRAVITAYSSREEETDETPFITAAGTKVRPGVVAANWLPLGAKIRIPALFGDQVFTVEDRMHVRMNDKVDVWFSTTDEALRFGTQVARVEIL